MNELRDLYQEVIFDHYRSPRNYGPLPSANRDAEGHNPLCGDQLKLHLQVEDGVIRDAHFEGSGCAISTASASLMTEVLKGKREEDAMRLMQEFQRLVTGVGEPEGMGKLEALAGVREFPSRVKCATLAWHTMQAALENRHVPVTTE
ncbi:MAG: Fe-S cluster assembly sulfur transfer protein SufU [Methylophilaceae bacterium]|jgi:nitrogen fixation NifU-like protein|nr:SUF system NifU family Fe-S cluster assembly protein [Methylophilaceae bacterium]